MWVNITGLFAEKTSQDKGNLETTYYLFQAQALINQKAIKVFREKP